MLGVCVGVIVDLSAFVDVIVDVTTSICMCMCV